MADPFTGEIRLLPYNYVPQGWAMCQGQTYVIQAYPALYSILGTRFGGDGKTTFCIPNLQGRTVAGTGANGTDPFAPSFAQKGGFSTITLTDANMPPHTHAVNAIQVPQVQRSATPDGNLLTGIAFRPDTGTGAPTANPYVVPPGGVTGVNLHPASLSPFPGNNGAHENRQPVLALNWCICLDGEYPVNPN
jgi:microcystin-dependent protein